MGGNLDQGSLLALAENNGPEWEAFGDACNEIARDGKVVIFSAGAPIAQLENGQRIRRFDVAIFGGALGRADVFFVIGVADDMLYTGYEEESLRDFYRVLLPDGQHFDGYLFDPEVEEDEPETAMSRAWYATAPLRNKIWWAISSRLLDGREIAD